MIDSRYHATSPTDSDTAIAETADEGEPILHAAPVGAVPARGSRRLAAGAVGALLVVAVVAAALGSPMEDDAPECEGNSCRAQSGHLEGVLMMKTNTMQLDDCPAGYEGTEANIKGTGKSWSFGNLTDCASTCDGRDGCKGFEFHDKNGKCGTYLDGYVLSGKQNHRWLTCIKQDVIATTQAPTGMPTPSPTSVPQKVVAESTVTGVDYNALNSNQAAYDAFETSMKKAFADAAGVSEDQVAIDVTAASVKVKAEITVSEGAAENILQLVTAPSVSDKIVNAIKQAVKSNPALDDAVTGELTASPPKGRVELGPDVSGTTDEPEDSVTEEGPDVLGTTDEPDDSVTEEGPDVLGATDEPDDSVPVSTNSPVNNDPSTTEDLSMVETTV